MTDSRGRPTSGSRDEIPGKLTVKVPILSPFFTYETEVSADSAVGRVWRCPDLLTHPT